MEHIHLHCVPVPSYWMQKEEGLTLMNDLSQAAVMSQDTSVLCRLYIKNFMTRPVTTYFRPGVGEGRACG